MIFTTNKPLNEWGKVLHDEDMAAAILDRVLECGRFIHFDEPSGRTRHLNLEETLPANTKRLRVSGIDGSEFPEPTADAAVPRRRCSTVIIEALPPFFEREQQNWVNFLERDGPI